jgi:hypothetical protein
MKKMVLAFVAVLSLVGVALALGSEVSGSAYGVMYIQKQYVSQASAELRTSQTVVTFGASGSASVFGVTVTGTTNTTVTYCRSYTLYTENFRDWYHRYAYFYLNGNAGTQTGPIHTSDYAYGYQVTRVGQYGTPYQC